MGSTSLVALFSACESQKKDGRMHIFSVPRSLVKPFSSDVVSILASFAKLPCPDQNLLLGWTLGDIKKKEPKEGLRYDYRASMRRLYHLIRQEKPFFEERIDPRDFYRVFVVEPQQAFARIRAQSGAFLISAFHERFETREILKWNGASRFRVEPGGRRGEVEPPKVKVDGRPKALSAAEAAGPFLDPLDARVDGFGACVGDFAGCGVDHPVPVPLDHPGDALHRFQA